MFFFFGIPQGFIVACILISLRSNTQKSSQAAYLLMGVSGCSFGALLFPPVTKYAYKLATNPDLNSTISNVTKTCYGEEFSYETSLDTQIRTTAIENVFYTHAVITLLDFFAVMLIEPSKDLKSSTIAEETTGLTKSVDTSVIDNSEQTNLTEPSNVNSKTNAEIFKQVFSSKKIWLLTFNTIIFGTSAFCLLTYLGPYYKEMGMGLERKTDFVMLYALCEFLGRFGWVALSKTGATSVNLGSLNFTIVGILCLFYGFHTRLGIFEDQCAGDFTSPFSIIQFFLACNASGFLGFTLAILTEITDDDTYLVSYGFINAVNGIALSIAPMYGGILVAYLGWSYWSVMASCGGLMLVGACFVMAINYV